ncbi:hypothetical protein ILYODFUR_035393 [Ilyodon furcidens]|uniref:Uncharacterized protein n=1 Tax=Ilyodon furcidens TaxID=33524 RepID=A0ABV0SRT3_9TELE
MVYLTGFSFLDKQPCFCLLTNHLCITLGSVCLNLSPVHVLCPDLCFKPLPWILLPDSVLLALTPFVFPDHRILLSHWICRPDSLCDITLLLPDNHTEELRFSFLILPRILKRFLCLPLVVSCRPPSRNASAVSG